VNTWDSILVAVTTAVVTIGLSEGTRALRERAVDRHRSADFKITPQPITGVGPGAFSYVTNIGDAPAHDVNFTLTGDGKFDMHPDARLDLCKPGDGFLIYVTSPGSGIGRIEWTDSRGRTRSVDRMPSA